MNKTPTTPALPVFCFALLSISEATLITLCAIGWAAMVNLGALA